VAWQATLRRQATLEAEKRRQEAQEAARKAAERAAETGEDAPPPAEVPEIEVPRTVSGGTGRMGTQVRLEVGEIMTLADCPREWLTLVTTAARSAFLAASAAGMVQKPEPGESVVWKGVRFSSVELVVNRR